MQALQKGKGQFYPVLVRPQTICVGSFDLDEKCRDNPLLLWHARDLFRFSQELKSKTITPTNEFLATRWNCGHSKVQQLLDRLEALHIITRLTRPPRQGIQGWRQFRSITLHLAHSPRKTNSHTNKKATNVVKTKPQLRTSLKKRGHSLSVAQDVLLSKQHVSRGWLAQLLKNLGANDRTVGYGLTFHKAIQFHPEALESWLRELTQPSVRTPLGMLIFRMKEYAREDLPPRTATQPGHGSTAGHSRPAMV